MHFNEGKMDQDVFVCNDGVSQFIYLCMSAFLSNVL